MTQSQTVNNITNENMSVTNTDDQFYQRVINSCVKANNTNINYSRELKIISFNVEGVVKKEETLKEIIELVDPDIIACQETYLTLSSALKYKHSFNDRVLTSRSGDQFIKDRWLRLGYQNKHGVASIIKSEIMKDCIEIDSQSDRILIQRVGLGKNTCLVISVYLPTNSTAAADQKKFEAVLHELHALIMNNRKPNEEMVITGDLNLCYITHSSKRRIDAMDKFIKNINCRYFVSRHPTHVSKRHGTVSWLDAAIISEGIVIESLLPLTETELPINPSSHYPLLIKIKLKGDVEIKRKVARYQGPFLSYKRPRWADINVELFHKLSDNFQRTAEYLLHDMSWEIKTKAFCDGIALATNLATYKKEICVDQEKILHDQKVSIL